MSHYSTVQAAKRLGLSTMTLHRYIRGKKIPVPEVQELAGVRVRVWTDQDVERIRALLPKIANGRKTRYAKKQLAIGNSQLAKPKAKAKSKKKPQPRAAHGAPHGQPGQAGSSTVPHDLRRKKQPKKSKP